MFSLKKIVQKLRRQRAILVLLFFICFVIFLGVTYLKPAWDIRSDGFGYYSYLRSLFFDGNIFFGNEQDFFKDTFDIKKRTFYDHVTTTGYYPNPFAIGSAILWLPFFLVAVVLQKLFNFENYLCLPGYNAPFQSLLNVASIFYGLLGAYFSFKTARLFFKQSTSLFAVLSIVLASPLIYYFIYEGIWSHLNSFFMISLFYYAYFYFQKRDMVGKYMALGLIFGLAVLVRWQNLLFGSVFVLEFLFTAGEWLALNKKEGRKYNIKYVFGFIVVSVKKYGQIMLGLLIAFLPQMFAWKLVYGEVLVIPESNTHLSLFEPAFVDFLFSKARGFFIWSPIYVISILGLLLFLRQKSFKAWSLTKRVMTFLMLTVPFLLQVYLNSSLSDWYGGGAPGAFGARRMLNASVIYILGLAAFYSLFYQSKKKWPKLIPFLLTLILVSLNILLMIAMARGYIEFDLSGNLWQVFIEKLHLL
ncbi:glycosyltransferase family 39 protein [Patescibacteria group bacterium]|nr:glycosyltransferase family 39 protein [Patescibacteria group bacterium]